MRKTLAILIMMSVLPMTMVACSPNRLYESFYPQYKAEDSCGFVQNVYNQRISWKGKLPIHLQVHESFPAADMDALFAAAKQWELVLGRKAFDIDTTLVTGPLSPRQDGQNIIYYLSDWEADRPTEQARTTVYWVGDQIYEADIRINSKNFTFYLDEPQNGGDVHLESLLVHELGHVLGFKHNDSGGSVMATYLSSNTIRDQIGSIDSNELRCEY